jgi:predicted benzoate:H+ symporter BenE
MLCDKIKNYRNLIAIGQFTLLLGLFGSTASIQLGNFGMIPDLWQGVLAGLASFLVGISIVFNVKGLMQYRLSRQCTK